jgi:hypothetical protein
MLLESGEGSAVENESNPQDRDKWCTRSSGKVRILKVQGCFGT